MCWKLKFFLKAFKVLAFNEIEKKKFIRARWIRDWLEPTRRYSPRSLFIIFSYTTCSQGLEKLLIILLSEKQFYVETKRRMHEKKVKEIKKSWEFLFERYNNKCASEGYQSNKKEKKFNIPRIHKFGALVVIQISHTYYD